MPTNPLGNQQPIWWPRWTYPGGHGAPRWLSLAQVPQHPDDDHTGLQAVGAGLRSTEDGFGIIMRFLVSISPFLPLIGLYYGVEDIKGDISYHQV